MASGVTVAYNGNVIHQMAGNGNFKMNTNGVYMEGDVDVVVDVAGGGGGTLISKSISANGIYNAQDDNADGYSQVTVNVSGGGDGGVGIPIGGETGSFFNSQITSIRGNAFYSCNGLTGATFPIATTIGGSAFYGCKNLSEISFPECENIGMSAFANCSALTEISFPECSDIGSYAFYSCSRISEATFPICKKIGSNAFYNCSSLGTLSLPSCTNIYSSAFYGCRKLSQLYLLGSSRVVIQSAYVFLNTPIYYSSYLGYFGSVYVPASLYNNYISAQYWSTLSSRIVSLTDEEIAQL